MLIQRSRDAADLSGVRAHVPGSEAYMERARRVIPRGMSSRGRVRAVPVAFREGRGSHLVDVDGNDYVDLVMALGPLLLGHSPEPVIAAVRRSLDHSVQMGGQHLGEAELAEKLVRRVPSAEKVLFANTGSEAVMAAVRIARATTGRRVVVKFEGHYHGWIDPMFVNSPGVPPSTPARGVVPTVHNIAGQAVSTDVVVVPWGDLPALETVFAERGDEIAAVFTEPIPFNLGTMMPPVGYLESVRDLAHRHGALLVFDEIVSGFRLGVGGAQELLGVTPDITTLAKAIAAGFPLAAVVGTDEAMQSAVDGPVIHGGTYNGTPLAVAAGNATLTHLEDNEEEVYSVLAARSRQLATGLREVAATHDVPLVVNQVGSVLQLLWAPHTPVRSYADAAQADPGPIADIGELVLARGVHTAPRGIQFVSTAHTETDIDRVVAAFADTVAELATRSVG